MIAIKARQQHITDKQAVFHKKSPAEAFVRGYVGGRGCGKTKIGALDLISRARDGDQGMIVAETFGRIEDTVWPAMEESARELDKWLGGRMNPQPKCWIKTQDGGRAAFTFYSGIEPDRLRGPNKCMLWIDEASLQPREVFDWGKGVLRQRKHRGQNFCIMTFTPRGTRHWTFDVFYEKVDSMVEADILQQQGVEIKEFAGSLYRLKPNRFLVQAHTLENPFNPDDYYDNIRQDYSTALAAQECAGQFVDLAGLLFQRHWFEIVDSVPAKAKRVRYWDKAGTPARDNPAAAFSAGVLAADDGERFYIEDVKRGQWSFDERENIMKATASEDQQNHQRYTHVEVGLEQEGGSGGKESAERSVRMLAKYPVFRDTVTGKKYKTFAGEKIPGQAKVDRAQGWCAQAEAGNVAIKRGAWNDDYLAEVCAFPEFSFADQVDATSGAINRLAKKRGYGEKPPEHVPMAMPAKGQYGVHLVRGEQTRGARRPQTRRIRR